MPLQPYADGPYIWLRETASSYYISVFLRKNDLIFCDVNGNTIYPKDAEIIFSPYPKIDVYNPIKNNYYYGEIFVKESNTTNVNTFEFINIPVVPTNVAHPVFFNNAAYSCLEIRITKFMGVNNYAIVGKTAVNKDDADDLAGGGGANPYNDTLI